MSTKSIELATLILILLERSLSVLPKESHYDSPKYWPNMAARYSTFCGTLWMKRALVLKGGGHDDPGNGFTEQMRKSFSRDAFSCVGLLFEVYQDI